MLDTYDYADTADAESTDWSGEGPYDAYPDYPDYQDAAWGEAKRRPPPVRTSSGRSAYSPRPTGTSQPVTQAQLQTALAKVSAQMTVNSNAIKTLDGRVRGVADDQSKLQAAFRKDSADRRKDLDGVKRDLQQTKELAALIPLVTAPANTPTIARLAPLLFLLPGDALTSGYGGSSSSSSNSLLGGSNLLAIAAIALAATGGHI